jgi:hypothetical protein
MSHRYASKPMLTALLSVSCQISAKFGFCTVVDLNGTLVEAKTSTSPPENVRILSSTNVPFRSMTTVQMPNLNVNILVWRRMLNFLPLLQSYFKIPVYLLLF